MVSILSTFSTIYVWFTRLQVLYVVEHGSDRCENSWRAAFYPSSWNESTRNWPGVFLWMFLGGFYSIWTYSKTYMQNRYAFIHSFGMVYIPRQWQRVCDVFYIIIIYNTPYCKGWGCDVTTGMTFCFLLSLFSDVDRFNLYVNYCLLSLIVFILFLFYSVIGCSIVWKLDFISIIFWVQK